MSSNDYCHPCSPPTSLKMSNQFEKFTITNLIKKENFLWKKEREKTTSIHYLVFVLGQNEIWILIDCVSALFCLSSTRYFCSLCNDLMFEFKHIIHGSFNQLSYGIWSFVCLNFKFLNIIIISKSNEEC